MSYFDHDTVAEGPARARPASVQRATGGASNDLLDLQRSAGNAAVSQAIQSGRFDSGVAVQREEGESAEDEQEEKAGQEMSSAGSEEEEKETEE